jgi:hypothetical protein
MAGAVIRPLMTRAAQAAVLEEAGAFPAGGVWARAALKWAAHGTAR